MKIELLIDATRLLAVDTEAASRPHHLETLLARGEPLPIDAARLDEHLLARFGAGRDEDAPGVAALSLLGEGHDPAADYWLRLDPVCVQATQSHLLLAPLPPDDLSADEARSLAQALHGHLSADGHALRVVHPQRWYLRCAAAPALRTRPPHVCAGELSAQHLPAGADGAAWRRLITEAQMLLYPLEVNAARESAGKLPANAVWPWGGGRLPRVASPGYTQVHANDALCLGLARAAGIGAAALPASADEALARAAADAAVLIVLTEHEAVDVAQMERAWFAPLAAALANARLDALDLVLVRRARPLGRRIRRAHLRRWWRRAQPVSRHA